MTQLIINKYNNQDATLYEVRNEQLQTTKIKSNNPNYRIGSFLLTKKYQNRWTIVDEVTKPNDFLSYYPQGTTSTVELKSITADFLQMITNSNLKIIVETLLAEYELFYTYPAGKSMHHAYIGGLAEHTIALLHHACYFSDFYKLNKDLLLTAVILHDLGKVIELSNYGLEYSKAGTLIGHHVLICELIYKTACDYGIEQENDILNLRHLILAHHGKVEHGSPKEPHLLEAYVLSVIDEIDAKVDAINFALVGKKSEESVVVPAFNRQKFFLT